MWSEQHDNEFKRAAASSHPEYDEKSWEKMKGLLDTHLPEKKKRRRYFFWIPLSLAAGLLLLFFINPGNVLENNHGTDKTKNEISVPENTITQKNKEVDNDKSALKQNEEKNMQQPLQVIAQADNNRKEKTVELIHKTSTTKTIVQQSTKHKKNNKQPQIKKESEILEENAETVITNNITEKKMDEKYESQSKETVNPEIKTELNTDSSSSLTNADKTIINAPEIQEKVENEKSDSTSDAKKTASPSTKNKFLLTISAGPDVSFSQADKMGKTTLQTGLGFAYTIGSRWRIGAGFYVAKKIYTADSAKYNPPAAFWNYYDNLQYADASCLVYEIPVSVSYNFVNKPKYDLFASTGISSVIMKEEVYNYHFKTAGGYPTQRERTYKNENKHLFSTLQFSLGYRYHISPRLSLQAEPYFNMPLSGIGFGKVKLKSTGLLFTLGFQPFEK